MGLWLRLLADPCKMCREWPGWLLSTPSNTPPERGRKVGVVGKTVAVAEAAAEDLVGVRLSSVDGAREVRPGEWERVGSALLLREVRETGAEAAAA